MESTGTGWEWPRANLVYRMEGVRRFDWFWSICWVWRRQGMAEDLRSIGDWELQGNEDNIKSETRLNCQYHQPSCYLESSHRPVSFTGFQFQINHPRCLNHRFCLDSPLAGLDFPTMSSFEYLPFDHPKLQSGSTRPLQIFSKFLNSPRISFLIAYIVTTRVQQVHFKY